MGLQAARRHLGRPLAAFWLILWRLFAAKMMANTIARKNMRSGNTGSDQTAVIFGTICGDVSSNRRAGTLAEP
jgi:hypothetical protein